MNDRNVKPKQKEIPLVVKGKMSMDFKRGPLLGKGGFARCYEFGWNKQIFAGKCLSKQKMLNKSQIDKVVQEIRIHSALNNVNVVNLLGHFADEDNVYLLLELCARRSLMELSKRRRTVTEPEARYFTDQLVAGCEYLHSQQIIHRDLKLENIFLNEEIIIKIGDFGLATKVDIDWLLNTTLCGTPNYMAPEMLIGDGHHSYGVDIWAVGCILYTFLCGKLPFEAESLKQTYARIRNNKYVIPRRIGHDAHNLISQLLAASPKNRPKVQDIRNHPFFTDGFMPNALPTSCLVFAPRFNAEAVSGGMVPQGTRMNFNSPVQQKNALRIRPDTASPRVRQDAAMVIANVRRPSENADDITVDQYLEYLVKLLLPFKNARMLRKRAMDVQEQDPAASPIYWIAQYMDYSNKYGLAYQLSDGSVGVMYNDATKIMVNRHGEEIQYTESDNTEYYFKMSEYPQKLEKKVNQLRFFRGSMSKHLITTGQEMRRQGDELSRLPQLSVWIKNHLAMSFMMADGTLQVNFLEDHTKVIVSAAMTAATYINANGGCTTYKLSHLIKHGCTAEIQHPLGYAEDMAGQLLKRFHEQRLWTFIP